MAESDECARCHHSFEQHDTIDESFAGPCAACTCEEFVPPKNPEPTPGPGGPAR